MIASAFLRDVGADAAAFGAILGTLLVLATFAQKSFSGVDRVFDWLQARRMAALARSLYPVIESAVAPIAVRLSEHLAEEEGLTRELRDELVAFMAEQRGEHEEMWALLAAHNIDRRKP